MILIIEDNEIKLNKARNLINKQLNHREEIKTASNFEEAVDILNDSKHTIKLIILDFGIPKDGNQPCVENGVELYEKIKEKNICVIGYSRTREMENQYNDVIKSMDFVEYSVQNEWESRLVKFIEEKECTLFENKSYDVVIITALKVEFEWMQKASGVEWEININYDNDLFNFYTTRIFSDEHNSLSVVAYAVRDMGLSASAIWSTKMILEFNPRYIVMTGVCAGNKNKTNKGDIIIPRYVYNYQSVDILDNKDIPSYQPRELDDMLRTKLEDATNSFGLSKDIISSWREVHPESILNLDKFNIHQEKAYLASGSSVVKSNKIFDELGDHTKQIFGLDMEAYSIMLSVSVKKDRAPIPLIIKTVKDYADVEKDNTYEKFGSYASAKYFFLFCQKVLIDYTVNHQKK